MSTDAAFRLVGWIRFQHGNNDVGISILSNGTNAVFVPETDKKLSIIDFHQFYNEQGYRIDRDLPPAWQQKAYQKGDRVPVPFRINGTTHIIDSGSEADFLSVYGLHLPNEVIEDIAKILRSAEEDEYHPVQMTRPETTRFYRGVGIGTFDHRRDARIDGFIARNPTVERSPHLIVQHIMGRTNSPFISLVRSYAVAEDYARDSSRVFPSRENPGYVYEIDLHDSSEVTLVEPIQEIVFGFSPLTMPFHTGGMDLLKAVVDPVNYATILNAPERHVPGATVAPRPPQVPYELAALIRVLRDTEVLAVGMIPAKFVLSRYQVY
jgi:hypothetical protein